MGVSAAPTHLHCCRKRPEHLYQARHPHRPSSRRTPGSRPVRLITPKAVRQWSRRRKCLMPLRLVRNTALTLKGDNTHWKRQHPIRQRRCIFRRGSSFPVSQFYGGYGKGSAKGGRVDGSPGEGYAKAPPLNVRNVRGMSPRLCSSRVHWSVDHMEVIVEGHGASAIPYSTIENSHPGIPEKAGIQRSNPDSRKPRPLTPPTAWQAHCSIDNRYRYIAAIKRFESSVSR